jgi:hypothetical protein
MTMIESPPEMVNWHRRPPPRPKLRHWKRLLVPAYDLMNNPGSRCIASDTASGVSNTHITKASFPMALRG